MCGITGIFNLNGKPANADLVRKMTDALAHRGPDGNGVFVHNHIGLGHRRLSILDISDNGAQPMHSTDNEWVISFNGCVYNFIELKE